jgi:hypothetical protein
MWEVVLRKMKKIPYAFLDFLAIICAKTIARINIILIFVYIRKHNSCLVFYRTYSIISHKLIQSVENKLCNNYVYIYMYI